MVELKTDAEMHNEMVTRLLDFKKKELRALLLEIYDVLDWMPGDDETDLGQFSMMQLEHIGALFPGGDNGRLTLEQFHDELKTMDFSSLVENYIEARAGKYVSMLDVLPMAETIEFQEQIAEFEEQINRVVEESQDEDNKPGI